MQTRPLCFGLTGLGGFAGYACSRLLDAGAAEKDSPARLLAVVEPRLERFGRRAEQLRARGVQIVRSYRRLLDLPIDAVWLPLPIDLHRRFTERALASGKAVLCEKPAAGCVDDVDAMIAAREACRGIALVGFQDVYQPSVAKLKSRLLQGDLGAPISASVIGCWPRDLHYFSRNHWAGKLCRRGRWVMDSPAGNALAHFLHLALFLLGEQLSDAAYPTEVAAELYRANPIESYDTCALRYSISRGGREVPLIVAFTHACDSAIEPEVTIHCEHGRIRYLAGRHAEICIGTRVEILPLQPDPYPGLLESFRQHYLEQSGAGSHDGRPSPLVATLESARAHVVAVNAAAEAAEIIDIPAEFITEVRLADHATPIRAIDGIVAALTALTSAAGSSGRGLLHESGAFDWTHPAGRMRIPAGYHHFAGPRARAASEPVEHDEAWPMEPAESIPPLGAQA